MTSVSGPLSLTSNVGANSTYSGHYALPSSESAEEEGARLREDFINRMTDAASSIHDISRSSDNQQLKHAIANVEDSLYSGVFENGDMQKVRSALEHLQSIDARAAEKAATSALTIVSQAGTIRALNQFTNGELEQVARDLAGVRAQDNTSVTPSSLVRRPHEGNLSLVPTSHDSSDESSWSERSDSEGRSLVPLNQGSRTTALLQRPGQSTGSPQDTALHSVNPSQLSLEALRESRMTRMPNLYQEHSLVPGRQFAPQTTDVSRAPGAYGNQARSINSPSYTQEVRSSAQSPFEDLASFMTGGLGFHSDMHRAISNASQGMNASEFKRNFKDWESDDKQEDFHERTAERDGTSMYAATRTGRDGSRMEVFSSTTVGNGKMTMGHWSAPGMSGQSFSSSTLGPADPSAMMRSVFSSGGMESIMPSRAQRSLISAF